MLGLNKNLQSLKYAKDDPSIYGIELFSKDKFINEGDSFSHLRDMYLFHANARVDMMKDLKKIIMTCESYEFIPI